MTRLKLWQESNFEKNQNVTKLKKRRKNQCDKNQIVSTKKEEEKINVTKIKFWQNLKTQIMTKLKNVNCERKKLQQGLLVRTFWHLDNGCDVLWVVFCNSHDVL